MTRCQCQSKVRVTHGQCLQTDNQSHAVLQLNRDGSQRSTGDVQLTKWLVKLMCFLQRDVELTRQLRVNRRLANQTVNGAFLQPAVLGHVARA